MIQIYEHERDANELLARATVAWKQQIDETHARLAGSLGAMAGVRQAIDHLSPRDAELYRAIEAYGQLIRGAGVRP